MGMLEQLSQINAVPIVQDDDTVVDLIGIVISAPGSLVFLNGKDEEVTFEVPAAVADETVTALPFTLWGKITRILEDTTIADADLMGLKKD